MKYATRICAFLLLLPFFYVHAEAAGKSPIAVNTEKLIQGAREEVGRRPFYRSAYYSGGYPPAHEGVCTDLIW